MTESQEPDRGGGDIAVAERRGSHCLVRRDCRFAVVECRNARIYRLGGARRGFPETATGIAAAVGEDWTDEATARRLFGDIVQRGESLAQRLW